MSVEINRYEWGDWAIERFANETWLEAVLRLGRGHHLGESVAGDYAEYRLMGYSEEDAAMQTLISHGLAGKVFRA